MKILLVYPEFPNTFWSFKHALSFVDKKASSPPLGLITVSAMLPKDWEKKLIDLNVSKLKKKDIQWADIVFVSAMVVQRESADDVINLCKDLGKLIVAGGPLFTGEFDKFPKVDHFVLNEAEITLPQFLEDFNIGSLKKLYSTKEYPDIKETPIPDWELVDFKKYDSMSIQFSRGCPFNCEFCNVTALLGHIPRIKSAQQIIAELDSLYEMGWRRNIFFVDDNFIGNKKILKQEILPALIEWRRYKNGSKFITEASINLADDPELVEMMVAAGFHSVFVGIETPDEDSLAECKKTQNKNRNLLESVRFLQNSGLQVMGGFIVGFDNDKPSIFKQQIEFIQQSGIVTAMVGILQAPFGTQLYARLKKENRIIEEMSGDNSDGSTNIIPKMDMAKLKKGYQQIVNQIYSPKLFYKRVRNFIVEYQPQKNNSRSSLEFTEIKAFFRSVYKLGIVGAERLHYWKLFFWTLFKYPSKFSLAITFSIYGYHFRKVAAATVSNQ